MSKLARRTFLRGLGGVAVALPFLDAMRTPGQTQAVRRYVQAFTPLGMSPGLWYTNDGALQTSDWASALSAHASDMLVVRGMRSWNGAAGHHDGVGATFTGASNDGGYGISLDQQIAQLIEPGTFPSLAQGFFTTDDTSNPGETQTVFAGPGSVITPERDPRALFTTLFGGGTAGGAEALEETHRRRRSILDLVRDDYRDAQVGLSASDRRRLSDHAENIRALEMTLGQIGPSCGGGTPDDYTVALDESLGAELSRAHTRLLALALACDLTRVASMQWSYAVNGIKYRWLEGRQAGISEKSHHGWTHHPSTGDWSQGLRYFREIERWYLEEVGFLVDELKRLDAFEGTLVLWGTNEPRGPHGADEDGREDLTYVLFGDLNGHFDTGKVVDVQVDGYRPPESRHDYRPALLLAIAQAFGYGADTFGSSYHCQGGPMPGLTA